MTLTSSGNFFSLIYSSANNPHCLKHPGLIHLPTLAPTPLLPHGIPPHPAPPPQPQKCPPSLFSQELYRGFASRQARGPGCFVWGREWGSHTVVVGDFTVKFGFLASLEKKKFSSYIVPHGPVPFECQPGRLRKFSLQTFQVRVSSGAGEGDGQT